MVKFYVRRILVDKKMTIDEVPMRWRAKVILWTCPKGHFKFWHGWGLAWLRP